MASKGGVVCWPGVEKVKFTVSVRGHQWSSARHVHETLQEFARVIQVVFLDGFLGAKGCCRNCVLEFLQSGCGDGCWVMECEGELDEKSRTRVGYLRVGAPFSWLLFVM